MSVTPHASEICAATTFELYRMQRNDDDDDDDNDDDDDDNDDDDDLKNGI